MKKIVLVIFLSLCFLTISVLGMKGTNAYERVPQVNHELGKEIITLVDETTNLDTLLDPCTTEDYYPSSRRWNGCPTVITAGNNIFIAWLTGGVKEPDPDHLNYINIAASCDGGNTWIDPYIVIDPPGNRWVGNIPMFYYNNEGRLFLWIGLSGDDAGIYKIEFFDMDGPLSDISYSEPQRSNTSDLPFLKPTLLSNGNILYASSASMASTVYRSLDDGETFMAISRTTGSTASVASQSGAHSSIIEKEDGTLWHLRRLDDASIGGLEECYSIDNGETWSEPVHSLPKPLFTPGSRFAMQKLKSGNILFITNAEGNGYLNRFKMTAYLSEDDGLTWPYSLSLDLSRSSYPDFYQSEDGTIYAAFDKDRYGEGGIRLCIFKEEDVKAGKYVSDISRQLLVVTKCHYEYADIQTIDSVFPRIVNVDKGTSVYDVLKKFGATKENNYTISVSVTDENGNKHEVKGKVTIPGYNPDKEGLYIGKFTPNGLKDTLKDSFGLFEFEVNVQEKKKGCSSMLGFSGCLFLTGFMMIPLFLKKKKIAREKNERYNLR